MFQNNPCLIQSDFWNNFLITSGFLVSDTWIKFRKYRCLIAPSLMFCIPKLLKKTTINILKAKFCRMLNIHERNDERKDRLSAKHCGRSSTLAWLLKPMFFLNQSWISNYQVLVIRGSSLENSKWFCNVQLIAFWKKEMFWLLLVGFLALGRTPIDLMKLVCGGFVGSVFLHDQIAHICFLSPQK